MSAMRPNPTLKHRNDADFSDVSILRRKWNAAAQTERSLPRYEDVLLGSLGRLADHMILLRSKNERLTILRAGRFAQQWLGSDNEFPLFDECSPHCKTALMGATAAALSDQQPFQAETPCVHDGMVQIFDLFALPTSTRWDENLIGVYVNTKGARYNLLDAIFTSTGEGFLSLSVIRNSANVAVDFQIVHSNEAAVRLLGVSADALRWRRLSDGGHPLFTPNHVHWIVSAIGGRSEKQIEITIGERDLCVSATSFGDIVSLTISDVTALKKREQSFRLLFENNPMPMWVFDAETKRFLSVNDAAVDHYGYDRPRFLAMVLQDLWPMDEREHHLIALEQLCDSYRTQHNWKHVKADGSELQVLTYGRRVVFDGRDGFLVAAVDITERRRAEARIAHMAHHDGLTELPNRVFFQQRLRELLSCDASAQRTAVLCVDLDFFKNVNDSFGHPVGDRLLERVASRMRDSVSGHNLVARLGGDEFAIILTTAVSFKEADDCAMSLIETLSAPYDIDGVEIVIGASIGIAFSPEDGDTSDELMRNADMALYRAKSEGGGVRRFFERDMDLQAQKRRDLEIDLRFALANHEFVLHYQPLIDLAGNRINGFEALLRWPHRDRGMVSPADFIPIAEDIGLITPLGEWVLRTACAEAATWPADIKIAVNLSPVQFRSRNLVQTVVSALAHSGLSPLRLELEITESLFLEETDANLAILHQLRALGIRISMDDFGTGFSSLSYLRSFPFDKIKIDRSFIRDLGERLDCAAIVRAISGLGRSLNITTTAEGVETVDQLDWLRSEGCDEVQGFLFSPARPASEIAQLLVNFAPRKFEAA